MENDKKYKLKIIFKIAIKKFNFFIILIILKEKCENSSWREQLRGNNKKKFPQKQNMCGNRNGGNSNKKYGISNGIMKYIRKDILA